MSAYLANENVPGDAVRAARSAGFDVRWMAEVAPGTPDDGVLADARSERRILLTFDKDFGEMVFRGGRRASCGIILFRPRLRSPDYLVQFVVNVLTQSHAWENHFTVAREGSLRMIPLK